MKNFLGLFLLLSLAGQPHAQASEATDNSIPSAVTHHSGNTSDTSIEDLLKLHKISGITSENGRNDAKRLNIRVVTVSNDDKPKNRETQRKADLRRRMVCKSLPVKE